MNREEFLSTLTLSLTSLCVLANEAPVKIEIKTRKVCERCKYWLGKSIVMQKGVRDAVIDLKNQTITITFNSQKTNAELLKKYIVSMGYDADVLKADIQKREILRDCCLMDITLCK